MIELINSNALHIPLADESVQCVITSPPYFGLRKYELGNQDHNELGLEKSPDCLGWATGNPCGECYVCHVVQWAREVKRVLRDDGVFWLNLGDSYAGSGNGSNDYRLKDDLGNIPQKKYKGQKPGNVIGLKPKDLILIPARVALALQADGWWVRNDVIWNKLNPMPESVKDRCTKSHEYVFMLTKSPKYYYDYVAILEPAAYDGRKDTKYKGGNKDMAGGAHERWPAKIRGFTTKDQIEDMQHHGGNVNCTYLLNDDGKTYPKRLYPNGNNQSLHDYKHSGYFKENGDELFTRDNNGLPARNKRDVWTIATSPFKGAHYAVFPPALVEPMIKASTSEKGCCPICGKPWVRIVEKEKHPADEDKIKEMEAKGVPRYTGNLWGDDKRHTKILDEHWQPACHCEAREPIPCLVLDPFAGSGTTCLVARNLGRSAIGCDLSYSYLHEQARKRLELDKLKFI